MQATVKSYVFPILRLAALLGLASGLTVERVRLVNNRTYINYELGASANNSLLECVYQLDEGEKIYKVSWEMWDDADKLGTYDWLPDSGGNATGSLEGVVELSREDGSLELTKLRYDLYGMYSCGVSLTNGKTKNTAKEEVLIVDVAGDRMFLENFQKCIYTTSYQSAAVFPEPTMHAGMFSQTLNKYGEEVPSQDWSKVTHPNGSVTYSYNVTFKIKEETPDYIVFKLMEGIFKSDGEYIALGGVTIMDSGWYKHGCPDLGEENKEVYYFPEDSATCRGRREYLTMATVTCKDGYQAEGDASKVTMRYSGTSHTWEPEQGHTATIEDLVCVNDSHHRKPWWRRQQWKSQPRLALGLSPRRRCSSLHFQPSID